MSEEIKLGKHSLKERNEFVDRKTASYMDKHPGVNRKKARKYARVKWARKVNTEAKKAQHPNKIRIAVKEES